jgi:hypothetical protein
MSATEAIKNTLSSKLNKKGGFELDKFKKSKNLSEKGRFKTQEWIPLSPAFNDSISLPGLPHGHISLIRGHSDTGKTTAMVEAAMSVQKLGKLPVFIVTEMKWSWDHVIKMGFPVKMIVDKSTGEINYDGDFIYIDRDSLNTIEDVAAFISDLLDEQKKGKLPVDLVFLWDSAGSIPCQQSYDSGKNNNMWNAGAMATQFGNFINQRIAMSRKASSEHTNSLIVVNKIRIEYPIGGNPMEKPKMRNKAGDAMYWDASLVVTFGNITNSGVSKIKATKNGKEVEFAKRTKISVDKNHITDVTTTSRVVITAHGFIRDDKKDVDKYKKDHSKDWLQILGSEDFDVIEESEMQEDVRDILDNMYEEE